MAHAQSQNKPSIHWIGDTRSFYHSASRWSKRMIAVVAKINCHNANANVCQIVKSITSSIKFCFSLGANTSAVSMYPCWMVKTRWRSWTLLCAGIPGCLCVREVQRYNQAIWNLSNLNHHLKNMWGTYDDPVTCNLVEGTGEHSGEGLPTNVTIEGGGMEVYYQTSSQPQSQYGGDAHGVMDNMPERTRRSRHRSREVGPISSLELNPSCKHQRRHDPARGDVVDYIHQLLKFSQEDERTFLLQLLIIWCAKLEVLRGLVLVVRWGQLARASLGLPRTALAVDSTINPFAIFSMYFYHISRMIIWWLWILWSSGGKILDRICLFTARFSPSRLTAFHGQ